jgi:type 1 glutamine amidotransferase
MKVLSRFLVPLIGLCLLLGAVVSAGESPEKGQAKTIVLVAGKPSHGPGFHEHNAAVLLLQKCLSGVPGVKVAVHLNGWPKDAAAFDNADSIMLFMDGGDGHALLQGDRLKQFGQLMKKGVGLACIHYATMVPKEKGGPELLEWIGGYCEPAYSVWPFWTADFKTLPKHPITRGVKPFALHDEWYYNMRFRPGMKGVLSILKAVPPDNTRATDAAKKHPGRAETVAWAVERPGGGRGFGFTGAHFHKNWGDDNFRKLVLNALLWTAQAEVPTGGVQFSVTEEDLQKNLDPK